MSDEQVIVVGAGPVGLWLAGELQLAGVPTLVLERAARRSPHAKALGMHPRTIEVLAMRGMEMAFLAGGVAVPSWHFGMLANRLDFRPLDTPFPFMLAHPQTRTEELFSERAVEFGARVLRGHAVTGLTQDHDSVTIEVTGPSGTYTQTAEFVVGCDGAGSTVRRAAGIDFPGTDSTVFGHLGDVVLDDPPKEPGRSWFTADGALAVAPIPGGLFRVMGYDPANQTPGVALTLESLKDWAIRVAGTDFGMRDPVWLTRFGNATRHAATYRDGRVLLAGDAAHMHFPAGGVGLNAGVQDAMNLGWKLAAVLQRRAAPELLDSYHTERHPVGAALGRHTLAQTALITATSPHGQALRTLMSDLIGSQPGLSLELAAMVSALDITYPPADPRAHPLAGTRAPGLFGLLQGGRPFLLNLSGSPLPAATTLAASLGIDTHSGEVADLAWAGATAVIVRPDGYVWWATSDRANLDVTTQHALHGLGARF